MWTGNERLHPRGAIAGLFLQLADRAGGEVFILLTGQVADQSSRQRDDATVHGGAVLLDEQELGIVRHRYDHGDTANVRSLDVFPAVARTQAQKPAGADSLDLAHCSHS